MSILIGKHEFDGPLTSFTDIPSAPGLYATLHEDSSGFMLVDIDQAENLSATLAERYQSLVNRPVVILRCASRSKRSFILDEIINEFEFEVDEFERAELELEISS